MKKTTCILVSGLLASACSMTATNEPMLVQFTDNAWDGKTVPSGQQCQKFGGNNPATPALTIEHLPAGTTAVVMEYSDRTYKPMDNGGHGKLGYKVQAGADSVSVPAVAGHTFKLPSGFYSIAPHQGPDWDKAGAYMPPCSGGNKHPYYVTVKALKRDQVLATSVVEMGLY